MLPLIAIAHPFANTHDDGFAFIRNIVIDLDSPVRSVMYSESLSQHSENLNFESYVSRAEIVSFVGDLMRDNPPGRNIIRSEAVEDIINESPYILVVEINEPLSLFHEQPITDGLFTDLYYVTVENLLKGNIDVGREIVIEFPADTVFEGERHTVAVVPIREGSNWFEFTSRNSLFQMDQLNEILQILTYQE